MDNLYDTDIFTWPERQADLLRRMARGERVNDQIDWGNVAEAGTRYRPPVSTRGPRLT